MAAAIGYYNINNATLYPEDPWNMYATGSVRNAPFVSAIQHLNNYSSSTPHVHPRELTQISTIERTQMNQMLANKLPYNDILTSLGSELVGLRKSISDFNKVSATSPRTVQMEAMQPGDVPAPL